MKTQKSDKNYIIRRLFLENEFEQIKSLQLNAREFIDHYPHHKEWLEMAINEMNVAERVAFGLISPQFDDTGSRPVQRVVGSIIIKFSTYSNVVEMKNLYVRNEYRTRGWGGHLFSEVEKFCRRKGYNFIETEVPHAEFNTVKFLLKNGFSLSSTQTSRFKKGDQIYTMTKVIDPLYSGDPFDLRSMFDWYLEKFWSLDVVRIHDLYTVFRPKMNNFSSDKTHDDPFYTIASVSLDDKNYLDSLSTLDSVSDKVDLIVVCSDNIEDFPDIHQSTPIKIKSKSDLFASMKGHLGYKIPAFNREDIGGMIVAFNPAIFEKLSSAGSHVPYYKGGPIGKYVQKNHRVILFSDGNREFEQGGIRGHATIIRTETGSPTKVKQKFSNLDPLIEEELFHRLFSNKRDLVGYEITDIRFIETLSASEIQNIFREPLDVDSSDIGHRYISKDELNRFLNLIAEKRNAKSSEQPLVNSGNDKISGPDFDQVSQSFQKK